MGYIEMMSRDGTSVTTADIIGSKGEKKYFRVMTEPYGKIFFASKRDYLMWVKKGRPYDGVVLSKEGGSSSSCYQDDADCEWSAAAEEYHALMSQLESAPRPTPETEEASASASAGAVPPAADGSG